MADTTVDAADAVVLLVNAAGLTEGTVFSRSFIPEYDPEDLTAPKGVVFPAGLELARSDRGSDVEDHAIEIGLGRRLQGADAETTDIETHLSSVQEIIAVFRLKVNRIITTPVEAEELLFLAAEVRLFIPELLRKRIALSVVRLTYRGFA